MIWDRFDDAHDDVLKDMRRLSNEIDRLQSQLKQANIAFEPFEKPESRDEPGPHGWYQDTLNEESALEAYRRYLRALLSPPPSP